MVQRNSTSVTLSPRMQAALHLCSVLDGSEPNTYAAFLLSSALQQEIEKHPALQERWVEMEREALQKGTWKWDTQNASSCSLPKRHNNRTFPLQLSTIPFSGLAHFQDRGDVDFVNDEFAGIPGQSARVEGFQIELDPPIPGLSMRYMAHIQNVGDVPWVHEGNFLGTRGQFKGLEGFAIELTGPSAPNYSVMYRARLQSIGDTDFCCDGQFCGTRGQTRQVEDILVHIEPR